MYVTMYKYFKIKHIYLGRTIWVTQLDCKIFIG